METKHNEFQEFVIDTFVALLSMCKEKNYTVEVLSVIGKDMKGLINHYASMYKYKDTYENIWQYSKFEFYKPLLMSEEAHKIFKANKGKGSYKKYKDKHKKPTDLLYWEHITPNEVVWKRICNVYSRYLSDDIKNNILKEEITKCFSNHKLVMLTKAEGNNLDKFGGRTGRKGLKNTDIKKIYDGSINIAAYRISWLFDEGMIKHMYLGDTKLQKEKIVSDNGCFVDKGIEYFSKSSFEIE